MLQLQFPQSTPYNEKKKERRKKYLKKRNETRKYSSGHQQEQTLLSMRGTANSNLNSTITSRGSRSGNRKRCSK